MPAWMRLRVLKAARIGRLLAFALALACQVSAGALDLAHAPAPSAPIKATLQAALILCSGGHHPGQDHPPCHRHLPDQAVAAQAHGFTHPATILDDAGFPPSSSARPAFWAFVPEARGPAARFAAAAYPTGPPPFLI